MDQRSGETNQTFQWEYHATFTDDWYLQETDIRDKLGGRLKRHRSEDEDYNQSPTSTHDYARSRNIREKICQYIGSWTLGTGKCFSSEPGNSFSLSCHKIKESFLYTGGGDPTSERDFITPLSEGRHMMLFDNPRLFTTFPIDSPPVKLRT